MYIWYLWSGILAPTLVVLCKNLKKKERLENRRYKAFTPLR